MPLINELTNETKFLNSVKEGMGEKSSSRFIYTGIVVEIDKYGGKWSRMGKAASAYTLKAYMPELDSSYEVDSLMFFEPLFPIHIAAIPEVGEEVLIIYDSPEKKRGWWIKRNDSVSITKTLPNKFLPENTSQEERIGATITKNDQPIDFKDTDVEPDSEQKVPLFRRKTGDVPIEGRSNTLILQTFSKDSKKGIVDIVSERVGNDVDPTKDVSSMQDREFQDTKGTRIFVATKFNVDTNEDWKLTETPKFKYSEQIRPANRAGDKNDHTDGAYLYVDTEEIRFVSRTSDQKLNNVILGNNQEVWLCSLLDALDQLSNVIGNNPGQKIVITSGAPNDLNLMSGGCQAFRVKLQRLRDDIHKHHSKKFYLN